MQSIGNETGRLHVIQMDVTSKEDVERARRIVETRLPEKGLWGIVNNAARYTIGFLEWLPMEEYESVCKLVQRFTVYSLIFYLHFNNITRRCMVLGRIDQFIRRHPSDESIFAINSEKSW